MLINVLNAFFPTMVFCAVLAAFYTGPDSYYYWVSSPTSILEMTTGVLLFITLVITVVFQLSYRGHNIKSIKKWLWAYALVVLYFLGEDQNWGQYYLELHVPDYFLEHNKEKELNLHNISSWFNQKPRFLMEMWVLICGILVPIGWRFPQTSLKNFVPQVLWPDMKMLYLSCLTIAITFPERFRQWFGFEFNVDWQSIRFSELQECCFAYFMLVYVILLISRIRQNQVTISG